MFYPETFNSEIVGIRLRGGGFLIFLTSVFILTDVYNYYTSCSRRMGVSYFPDKLT